MTFTVGLPHRPCFYWKLRLPTHLCSDDCGSIRAAGQIASKFLYWAVTDHVFLQALIFIIRREFMLVGWMVVYLISYVSYREHTVGTNTTSQLPRLQLLATCLFLLVHGRIRMG
jgi:hypothetical protein